MGDIIDINVSGQSLSQDRNGVDLIKVGEDILFDARATIGDKSTVSMPIAQLSALGAGVASLLPAFRTITQTTTVNAEGLYRLVNAGVGDTLKVAKNGNLWSALKTAAGGSKMAQFSEAAFAPSTTTTVMSINPATVMIAVALFSI